MYWPHLGYHERFFYMFSAEKESWHVDANIGIDLIMELSILGKGFMQLSPNFKIDFWFSANMLCFRKTT